ncbi:glycosyl transferase family 1 [Mameliella alba]|nr:MULTISPECIES: glycosyltransferase [Mameliella]MCR9275817.1 glycosyltransferase [Paracoccaceae bacterium]OWV60038.1 glycosyl transferase family 1 [Mameliella alba]
MKACIVVGEYFKSSETFVNRHIDLLFGGQTCVVAAKTNNLGPRTEGIFDIAGTRRSALDAVLRPFLVAWNGARYGTGRVPVAGTRRALLDFLRAERPDVILSEFGTQGVMIAPIANELGIPVFCYFRGKDASVTIQTAKGQRAYRLMMPRLDGIFAVSQFLLDNLASVGVHHDNAHVIPSGVDVRRFVPGQKRPRSLIGIGRFVEKKHPLLTIRAFAKAAVEVPEARLTMIGDGDLLNTARDLVVDLNLEDKVSLPGAMPHEQVRAHLENAEIYVQHSVTARDGNTEGLPTSIQEAMAAGCIVVSTDHAGIPEAVTPGVTGYLVPEHDEEGFAAAMAQALSQSPENRAAMSAAARQAAVERFDNAALLSRLEETIVHSLAVRRQ